MSEVSNTVKELVAEIKKVTGNQTSSSKKDEQRVMKAMLNDPSYKVGIYKSSGKDGEYCPYEDSRTIVANILTGGAKISSAEAKEIASGYEFGNAEANAFVGISKEFVNTYVQTGRKLPLGGRETMSVSLELKHVKEGTKTCPCGGFGNKTGERKETFIPAHDTLRASGPCPKYLKEDK